MRRGGETARCAKRCETSASANCRSLDKLEQPLRNRARHVITENDRVLRAVECADADEFGALMNASHASLRDDFEVSVPALDRLVALLQADSEVYGARLTGAGFGGACVALCRPSGHLANRSWKCLPTTRTMVSLVQCWCHRPRRTGVVMRDSGADPAYQQRLWAAQESPKSKRRAHGYDDLNERRHDSHTRCGYGHCLTSQPRCNAAAQCLRIALPEVVVCKRCSFFLTYAGISFISVLNICCLV